MAASVSLTPSQAQPLTLQARASSQLYRLIETIVQIAAYVFFIAGAIWAAAALLPPITLPLVALTATILVCRPSVEATPIILPPGAPRGLINSGQNCAFNALVHYLESDPQVAHWFRHPLTPDMDMAAFSHFLAGYNPPAHLMADFTTYVNAQVHPQPPIPDLFSHFIEIYDPQPADRVSFFRIQETYRSIRLVQESFRQFFADYDQAMQENRPYLEGTGLLRRAISQIAPWIRVENWQQEDVPEVLTPILGFLPLNQMVKIEQSTHYEVGEHPIAQLPDDTSRRGDQIGYFTLELREGVQQSRLQDLFAEFCNHDLQTEGGVNYEGIDGQMRRYRPDHCTNQILEAPPALRFQIKRFNYGEASQSWASWLGFSSDRLSRRDIPVDAPEEMEITLANGERRRYRLVSFINQHGSSARGGHYTACRIVEGVKYLLNDHHVIPVDQLRWKELLDQAYLLCYLPVPQ